MSDFLKIDGSMGEGGGQILRSSLALAALTQTPIAIHNIRQNRDKPGLQRQHLTAFRAAAEICGATVEGAEMRSRRATFRPGPIVPGSYHFAVGTAGSACLVFQTVLWPLLFAGGPSDITLEGGTHNSHAPPFDFIATSFLPIVRRMGATIDIRLERHGFYPAGGGRMIVHIEPCARLEPLTLLETGPILERTARAISSRLPAHVAERELAVVQERLGWAADECHVDKVRSPGPGNALVLTVWRAEVSHTVTGFGERGVPAERVATGAADELSALLDANVPVDSHLADQLIIPFTLARGGAFRSVAPSLHTKTNIDVVAMFLDARPRIEIEVESGSARVTFGS